MSAASVICHERAKTSRPGWPTKCYAVTHDISRDVGEAPCAPATIGVHRLTRAPVCTRREEGERHLLDVLEKLRAETQHDARPRPWQREKTALRRVRRR
jgi:hypothetical protein